MDTTLILFLFLLKGDKELSAKIKPLIKTILDNKELLTALLQENEAAEKTSATEREEKTPPPEANGEAANQAVKIFLERYIK